MLRPFRKSRNRKDSEPEDLPLSVIALTGASKLVRHIIFLTERNLVVAASWDCSARVYDIDTSGEPCAVFKRHDDSVNGVVQLENDLVASVGSDKRLFTWRAATAEMVGEWKHDAFLWSVAKLGESNIIVGDSKGNVMVLTHRSGSSFQVHRRLPNSHSRCVNDIIVYGDLFVTSSLDKTAKVWDTNSLTIRATLALDAWVWSAAVSGRNIVTSYGDGKIGVFQNGHDFNLLYDLSIGDGRVEHVAFISDDIVAATAGHYLYFISLPTKSVLSRVRIEDKLRSFTILSDGRIAVAGGYDVNTDKHGYCAIVTPPESMQGPLEDCVASLYPLSAIALARTPLRAAWLAVQDQQLTLADACKTAITSENCARSLDEWCIAHNLLMEALKRGEIPASRHLHDSIAHWHQVLYQHCAKLAMGQKCIAGVKLLFKEAEDAGVIAKGQVESLINTIGVRQDMDADNRFLVHATYQLFMRQAEMDVRLREVLHYQRVQQVTSVLNALIGCIPVGGAVLTNVSVLGIGKDVSGGFGSDSLVDRVLQRSNAVLSVEEWENIPAEKRKVVEDAASNLGLSIDELRKKLQVVASMQASEGMPLGRVVIEGVDEDTRIQSVIPVTDVFEGVGSLSLANAGADGAGPSAYAGAATTPGDEEECEMKVWEGKGVRKDVVGRLKRGELAGCFAAFLLGYESDGHASFPKLKEAIQETFNKKRIQGLLFVEADEEEKEELVDVLVIALANVTDEDTMKLTRMLVKKFIRLASQ